MDRWTGRLTEMHRQANKQLGRQADRQSDSQAHEWIDGQVG